MSAYLTSRARWSFPLLTTKPRFLAVFVLVHIMLFAFGLVNYWLKVGPLMILASSI